MARTTHFPTFFHAFHLAARVQRCHESNYHRMRCAGRMKRTIVNQLQTRWLFGVVRSFSRGFEKRVELQLLKKAGNSSSGQRRQQGSTAGCFSNSTLLGEEQRAAHSSCVQSDEKARTSRSTCVRVRSEASVEETGCREPVRTTHRVLRQLRPAFARALNVSQCGLKLCFGLTTKSERSGVQNCSKRKSGRVLEFEAIPDNQQQLSNAT
jgi:hypothetical protein